jgi:hypothetical protein
MTAFGSWGWWDRFWQISALLIAIAATTAELSGCAPDRSELPSATSDLRQS